MAGRVWLERTAILFPFGSTDDASVVRMMLSGGNSGADIQPEKPTGGVANYYYGGTTPKKLEGIPLFAAVRYRSIYPGTDLVLHGNTGTLEYDFELQPGSDPRKIVLSFSGIDDVRIEKDGALTLESGHQTLAMLPPIAHQDESKTPVQVVFRALGHNSIGFELGTYDHSKPLVIDPVVAYTTIIGATNRIEVGALSADSAGDAYVAGNTYAFDYPVTDNSRVPQGHYAGYLTKLDPSGQIAFSTEFQEGYPAALTAGPGGSVFMTGISGDGFPISPQSIATCSNPCNAGFVAKFDDSGRMQYSTLLASGQVNPRALVVDTSGSAYITGQASDASLPLVNPYQQTYQGGVCTSCNGAFFAKLNSSGTGYEFSSYFSTASGGSSGKAIALDSQGNIFLAGSGAVPLMHPLQTMTGSIFLSKFSPDGRTLLFSTQFGGIGTDTLTGMGVGSDGTVYLAGNTTSEDFPYSSNALRLPVTSVISYGTTHMFAAAYKPDLSGLKYSTYLGDGQALCTAFSGGKMYIAGTSGPGTIPLKNAVVSDLRAGGFVLSLDSEGMLASATQFGGHNTTQIPTALSVDPTGNIYVAGLPDSDVLSPNGDLLDPVNVGTAGYQRQVQLGVTTHLVGYTSFIAKIAPANEPQISLSVYQPFLVLRNAGSADLHIQSIVLGGELKKQWGNCGSTVAAGHSCILTVTDDNGMTVRNGSVTINSDANPSSQTFSPLLPPGANPFPAGSRVWVDPDALFFPPQLMGTTSEEQSFRVWNVGTVALPVTSIWTNGSLAQTNDCPNALDPGAFCTVHVRLTPDANAEGGNIVLMTFDTAASVDVYGWSTYANGPLLGSSTFFNFGGQLVGTPGVARTLNVTNATNSSIEAPTATIEGAAQFAISSTTCAGSLAAKASCNFSVSFTPTTNGTVTGSMKVVSGAGGTLSLQLVGYGVVDSSVSISPLDLSFYTLIIGVPSFVQPVTLTNHGSGPVKVTDISFSLADYSETNTCADPLPPEGACTINIVATTQALGDRNATMTVTFDSAATQTLEVTAESTTPLSSHVTALDFGTVTPIGSDSNPQFMDLGNGYAQGQALQPYTITVTGDFRVDAAHCPNPLPHFYGCGINVFFHPTKAGTQTGAITVSFPQTTAQLVIQLTGTASSAGVTISPDNLQFSTTVATTQSTPQILTIKNPQTFPVTLPPPVLSGTGAGDFQFTFNCSTINAGATCEVPVVFAPLVPGTRTATLTFQNGGTPAVPVPISLSGAASPAGGLGTLESGYNFGIVELGQSSNSWMVTIRNGGPYAVALPALNLSGSGAADFVVTPDSNCSSLSAYGGTCQVAVVFVPRTTGERNLSIKFSSGGSNPQTVALNAVGWGLDFAVSTGTSTLAQSIASGQSATYSIRLTSDNQTSYNSPVTVTCAAVGATYGPCTVSPSPVSLESGSATLTVKISPAVPATARTRPPGPEGWMFIAVAIFPLGIVVTTRRIPRTITLALCLLALLSCGGGGGGSSTSNGPPPTPPTPVTTYTYSLTMQSGTTTHSQTITLRVQ